MRAGSPTQMGSRERAAATWIAVRAWAVDGRQAALVRLLLWGWTGLAASRFLCTHGSVGRRRGRFQGAEPPLFVHSHYIGIILCTCLLALHEPSRITYIPSSPALPCLPGESWRWAGYMAWKGGGCTVTVLLMSLLLILSDICYLPARISVCLLYLGL
jgi:hypothetical protein